MIFDKFSACWFFSQVLCSEAQLIFQRFDLCQVFLEFLLIYKLNPIYHFYCILKGIPCLMLFINKLGRGSRVYLFYMSRQHIIILLAITVDLMIQ